MAVVERAELEAVRAYLVAGRDLAAAVARFAIGLPESEPYGVAVEHALDGLQVAAGTNRDLAPWVAEAVRVGCTDDEVLAAVRDGLKRG